MLYFGEYVKMGREGERKKKGGREEKKGGREEKEGREKGKRREGEREMIAIATCMQDNSSITVKEYIAKNLN